jgi:4-hydroxy 2-oxovalerate aldolase
MKCISILDCTLRDGGYINDWEFGHGTITGVYKRLEAAGVNYIEVGFLDDRRQFDINRTIMPNTDAVNKVFANVKKGHAIPIAMIDYGTCSIDSIGPAESTFIEGIRVIFKKEKIEQALPFCKSIKEKGYKLFIQAISITAYSDMEMLQYVEKINEIKPYAFSIVDTYGLLDNKSMTRYFHLIDDNLDPEIVMGYHDHNNFQLAYSNTMRFLSMETDRHLVADSSVYGMGKSAGNCATELLAMHLNDYYHKNYNLNEVMEIVDTFMMPIWQKNYWGYKYEFYIAAMQKVHPNFVNYLLKKKTLSVSSINEILAAIPEEQKLFFDKKLIEQLYLDYQGNSINDDNVYNSNFTDMLCNCNILLLGPGSSIADNSEDIMKTIEKDKPVVLSVNFYPKEFPVDCVFMSNNKRYAFLADYLGEDAKINAKFIATSNVHIVDLKPDYTLNFESLLIPQLENTDNALILLLSFLVKAGVKAVSLAGFDGYKVNEHNYYRKGYEVAVENSDNIKRNATMSNALSFFKDKLLISFITPTQYSI